MGVLVCICVGVPDTDELPVEEYDAIPEGEFADEYVRVTESVIDADTVFVNFTLRLDVPVADLVDDPV